jgi:hypothetical protein
MIPARTSHQRSAAAGDARHPASFSHFGVLDVLSSTTPRPARPGRSPQRRPWRAPWPCMPGAATTAMSSIAEERQRRRQGHGAATLRADGGRGRSHRCSSSTMLGHRLPSRASTSAREPHRRTALGAPAGPLGRERHWIQHLAGLATKPGEKYGPGACPSCENSRFLLTYRSLLALGGQWRIHESL